MNKNKKAWAWCKKPQPEPPLPAASVCFEKLDRLQAGQYLPMKNGDLYCRERQRAKCGEVLTLQMVPKGARCG